jgi:assimilatory nitrate reductase catalytic subunit
VRDALKRLELFIVSDNVASNDTVNAGVHVLLPAAAWGERDGTLTNSERRISRQRPFLPLPGEAKPDWWIVSETARRMGFAAGFAYRSPADVLREHAALSGFENNGTRAFDISGLATLTDTQYDQFAPVQWPMRNGKGQSVERFFSEGGYFTHDGKARFVAPERPALKAAISSAFPFRLNTGRIRDQWHTMTRTGLSPRLAVHAPEPFVEIHPDDANAACVVDGGLAVVATELGRCVLKVAVSGGQRRGSLFAPIHWSSDTASSARVGDLVASHADPHSGQPESKATPAAIAPVAFKSRGLLMTRRPLALPEATWWARAALSGGWSYLLATDETHDTWRSWLQSLYGKDAACSEYLDEPRSLFRSAVFVDDRLELCLFIHPFGAAPQWNAAKSLFAGDRLDALQRRYLLAGKAADGVADPGPIVCACFGVGLAAIRTEIESSKTADVDAIGKALRAGTNCGSCLPELKKIIAHDRAATPV